MTARETPQPAPPQPHNLLFITTDQQRLDSLPCYGLDFMRTPNLDRLARRRGGLRARLHAGAPVRADARRADERAVAVHAGVLGNNHWLLARHRRPNGVARAARHRPAGATARPPSARCTSTPGTPVSGFVERISAEDKRHTSAGRLPASSCAPTASRSPIPPPCPATSSTSRRSVFPHPKRFHVDGYVGDQAAGLAGPLLRGRPAAFRRLGLLPRPARSVRPAGRAGGDVLRRAHPGADPGPASWQQAARLSARGGAESQQRPVPDRPNQRDAEH